MMISPFLLCIWIVRLKTREVSYLLYEIKEDEEHATSLGSKCLQPEALR